MGVAEVVAGIVVLWLAVCTAAAAGSGRWRSEEGWGVQGEVTYDHRALVLNGTRRMLFSGEMHYPRSTPEVTSIANLLDPFAILHNWMCQCHRFGFLERCNFT